MHSQCTQLRRREGDSPHPPVPVPSISEEDFYLESSTGIPWSLEDTGNGTAFSWRHGGVATYVVWRQREERCCDGFVCNFRVCWGKKRISEFPKGPLWTLCHLKRDWVWRRADPETAGERSPVMGRTLHAHSKSERTSILFHFVLLK